ncbi:tau-tubulin kinase 1 [Anaeramoeba flamelloides]|uniref:Tau-tubulin kinase 1 n=1 Tax=Anaeramoeba flamelloides TaxID=1746091 RepID=A0ABQ8XAP1_9EUKA|nr:tau-tubulin kinase 1 [Anaeramoeba flamelloides]
MFEGAPLKGRWRLLNKIGRGGFVAVKMERIERKKKSLLYEVAVIKKLQDSKHSATFISSGRNTEYKYFVMELLGDNLSVLRKKQPSKKFSISTTIKLLIDMISSIEDLHALGYIHRDIKSSNFAIRKTKKSKTQEGIQKSYCCIIDFGLCRKYVQSNGELKPEREKVGFRGTAKFASINSHTEKDLSRRDDLWSLFYLIIEMLRGELPWGKYKDRNYILELKMQYTNKNFCKGLPEEFLLFYNYLDSLTFEDQPNYKYLKKIFTESYIRLGFDENTKYDWEIPNDQKKLKNLNSNINVSNKKKMINSLQENPKNFLDEIDQKNEIILPNLGEKNQIQFSSKNRNIDDEKNQITSSELTNSEKNTENEQELQKIIQMIQNDNSESSSSSSSSSSNDSMSKTGCKCIIC